MSVADRRDGSPARRRRSFAPVVLAGLAAGALAAVAAARPAAVADGVPADALVVPPRGADVPLASTLSLVVLAAWGAALVLRGRARRAVLALGLLAAVGTVAALAVAAESLGDVVRRPYVEAGYAGVEASLTGWYVAAWVGTVASVVALAAAVRLAPCWPEMGTRYDAPTAGSGAEGTTADPRPVDGDPETEPDGRRERDLWRALDEGRDPTVGPAE